MKIIRLKLIFLACTLLSSLSMLAGHLTNNGSVPINLIMYNNYVAPANGKSARGRLNQDGVVIQAGQNVNFLTGTSSIDVYYGNGNIAGIHANISPNFDYTISTAEGGWILTQDVQ
ncbi:hypothetical protein KBC04_02020 [Candidatus Babeliales bacterium]|nr:hypothetical protein [Candidatus Babeliales bacterium]MBP9843814.1 hypothetical protein [Candidatus Babeliales bacterium]